MAVGTEPGRLSRQQMRSAVNFGVAALARVTGAPADTPLRLRCECGTPACAAIVVVSLDDYSGVPLAGCLLVTPAHIDGARVLSRAAQRWALIDASAPVVG